MSISEKILRLKSARPGLIRTAAVFLGIFTAACRSVNEPYPAPAVGTLGGVAAGALIGSFNGNAGTGAVIGGMLGRSGGQIVSSERIRNANDAQLLSEISTTLQSAARFDGALEKEYHSLARRRATSPALETLPVRAVAGQKLPQIRSWINLLEANDHALARAISNATAYPTPKLGAWLKQRNQVRSRLSSLRMHQSWYKTLAS